MKKFLVLIILVGIAVFVYFKVQVSGDLNSYFNQTKRYTLGKRPTVRTILGLHNAGDARAEYFSDSGPISIVWFKPQIEELDSALLDKFSNFVGSYTGRKVDVVKGGRLEDSKIAYDNLGTYKLKSGFGLGPTPVLVFFTNDYSTRQANELSTTYQESGIVLSLSAHKQLLQSRGRNVEDYLLSSLLHEFGRQIGLQDNTLANCIMNSQKGPKGELLRFSGINPPTDFCEKEKSQINTIKSSFRK